MENFKDKLKCMYTSALIKDRQQLRPRVKQITILRKQMDGQRYCVRAHVDAVMIFFPSVRDGNGEFPVGEYPPPPSPRGKIPRPVPTNNNGDNIFPFPSPSGNNPRWDPIPILFRYIFSHIITLVNNDCLK